MSALLIDFHPCICATGPFLNLFFTCQWRITMQKSSRKF